MTQLTHETTPETDPAATGPSEGAPSEPTPSEGAPSEPTPSEGAPSEPTPSEPTPSEHGLDRRQLLARAGLAGAGVAAIGLLAACGADDDASGSSPTGQSATPVAAGLGAIVQVAAVPVGGSVKAKDENGRPIIVSQPQAGTIVAMTAICPHKGCEVKPDGKDVLCPCHASVFMLDGANVSGPATTPLAKVDVHVRDGHVYPGMA
jgi:cytochrome b6-f complex iron-sulfur subunit